MTTFGITPTGFVLKRLADILDDVDAALSLVQDPVTGEYLTPDLLDENDPLVQIKNALCDQLSVCWEQLQLCYNSKDPLAATDAALSSLVQLNALIREPSQTDTSLRLLQQASTALPSYRQVDAIYAAVVNVPAVKWARVYQNATLITDSRGIPAKSISIVTVDGDAQAIADAIFQEVPLGVGYFGPVTKTCSDNRGNQYQVAFEPASLVPIHIEVHIALLGDGEWPDTGIAQIQAALIAYAAYSLAPNIGLPPGEDVINSRLYTPVNTVPGHEITMIKLARGTDELAEINIAIAWNEVAQMTTDNITVVT